MTLNYFIFRSDVRRDSIELMSAPVIENPEHQTLWYSKYFLGKFHHNYVGQDSEKSTYVLSVVEEKSFGKSHCRSILWTKDGPKRLVIQGSPKSRSPKIILGQYGMNVEQPPKEVNIYEFLRKRTFRILCCTWLSSLILPTFSIKNLKIF